MAFGLPNVSYLGYPAPVLCAGHVGLGFRQASPRDAADLREHLGRLSSEDRRARFCAALSDAALNSHVETLWRRAHLVIAARDGPLWPGPFHAAGPVRALAELSIDGRDAEIGLSVDGALRRRGVGTYLVQTAARLLAPRGVERLLACTVARNDAMLRLADGCGAVVEASAAEVEIIFDVAALNQWYRQRRIADHGFRIAS